MKKILTAISSFALFLVSSAHAQTVDFKNLGSGLSAPVFDVDGSTYLSSSAGYTVELLAGATGGSLNSIATTTFSIDGFFFGGEQTITGISAGSVADIIIRVYNGSSFETSTIRGESTLFSVTTGGVGSPASPAATFNAASDPNSTSGLQSFQVSLAQVPEPTTIALGVMGGLALLARRRRNAA